MDDRRSRGALGSSRRALLGGLVGAGVLFSLPDLSAAVTGPSARPYEVPSLPYASDALEPGIDGRLLERHREYHREVVQTANAASAMLEERRRAEDFDGIEAVQGDLAGALSEHLLHTLFWRNLSPAGGEPDEALAAALERDFRSVEAFEREFTATAIELDGDGWSALAYDPLADRLLVLPVSGRAGNAVPGVTPLLVFDLWEHAYRPQYGTDRRAYLDALWNLVNWDAVAARFEAARSTRVPLDRDDADQPADEDGEPSVEDHQFEVRDRECTDASEGTADTTSDAEAGRVQIAGTIVGSDMCKTARLAAVSYDPAADALTVAVETTEAEEAGLCAQCLTAIEYEAVVRFGGGLPGTVSVTHDGEPIE